MTSHELGPGSSLPGLPAPVVRIRPPGRWLDLRLGELWAHRELVFFLALRDLKVRYKQTILGATWAIIQPILTMVVFSVFLGGFAKIPSDGVPYPIFALAALVPWYFFVNGLTNSSESLLRSSHIITKIYFPRLTIPVAAVGSGVVDLILAFLVLLGVMFYYGVVPTLAVVWLPLLVLLALATALGLGLWFSAMSVQFRDVRYAIPFLAQMWLFVTPVAYPTSLIPESWRVVYALNPMVGVVEGFRWALLGMERSPVELVAVSGAVSIVLLVSGAFYFQRMERTFADVV